MKLFERHWEELSPEERAARFEAENLKRRKAVMLVGMKEELIGVVAQLQRAEAEKARLADVDTSGFSGNERVEHVTAVALAAEAVITLAERVVHIEQTIRKVS
jgi:hypothetical protein